MGLNNPTECIFIERFYMQSTLLWIPINRRHAFCFLALSVPWPLRLWWAILDGSLRILPILNPVIQFTLRSLSSSHTEVICLEIWSKIWSRQRTTFFVSKISFSCSLNLVFLIFSVGILYYILWFLNYWLTFFILSSLTSGLICWNTFH